MGTKATSLALAEGTGEIERRPVRQRYEAATEMATVAGVNTPTNIMPPPEGTWKRLSLKRQRRKTMPACALI